MKRELTVSQYQYNKIVKTLKKIGFILCSMGGGYNYWVFQDQYDQIEDTYCGDWIVATTIADIDRYNVYVIDTMEYDYARECVVRTIPPKQVWTFKQFKKMINNAIEQYKNLKEMAKLNLINQMV